MTHSWDSRSTLSAAPVESTMSKNMTVTILRTSATADAGDRTSLMGSLLSNRRSWCEGWLDVGSSELGHWRFW